MTEKPETTEKTAKTERRQFRAIKGSRDILPPDSALWNWFEHSAREVFESYNFREIRPPIFEETSLFARSIGTDTDVVAKEMYSFEDHDHADLARLRSGLLLWEEWWGAEAISRSLGDLVAFLAASGRLYESGKVPRTDDNRWALDRLSELVEEISPQSEKLVEWDSFRGSTSEMHAARQALENGLKNIEKVVSDIMYALHAVSLGDQVTLRPEATASVCRAYIEHGMQTLPGNQKLYYVGPMFRRERPQKGRYRQFYQVGAEVLGTSDAPASDAEVLEMLLTFFNRVGLTNIKLYLNSIGHNAENCRRGYVELLRAELRKVKDQLKEDSQRRIETNPLRVLDSKLPEEQPVIEKLPRISEHLCDACREHFTKLKDELALRGIGYEENWRLVRGLDYYTRTTFEVTAAGLGSQNAVCGGGRYDGLVELLGGSAGLKGIGFAIGTDRAILSIQESGNLPKLPGLAVFIAWMGAKAYAPAVAIAKKLRERGFAIELPPEEMKFRKSLGLADKLGARYALIIGEDEAASGTFTLKRLSDGQQDKLDESALLRRLESELRGQDAR